MTTLDMSRVKLNKAYPVLQIVQVRTRRPNKERQEGAGLLKRDVASPQELADVFTSTTQEDVWMRITTGGTEEETFPISLDTWEWNSPLKEKFIIKGKTGPEWDQKVIFSCVLSDPNMNRPWRDHDIYLAFAKD